MMFDDDVLSCLIMFGDDTVLCLVMRPAAVVIEVTNIETSACWSVEDTWYNWST